VGQHIFLAGALAVVSAHYRRVALVHRVDGVHYVVVQHQVLEVNEAGYLLFPVYLVDHFLALGKHVVLDYLLTQ